MAGVEFSATTPEFLAAAKKLRRLAGFDEAQILDDIGEVMESGARRRIAEEKADPLGVPWAPWSESYAETREGHHSVLEGKGQLLDSQSYKTGPGEVRQGSNEEYAAIHQFGGEEVGMNIPERPYLGLSAEDEADIIAIVSDHIDELTRGRA